MLRSSWTLLPYLLAVLQLDIPLATAVPTWPSSVDELEDIQLLNTGYRARAFSTAVTPCSFSAQGPGRQASAEWLRTAFHDMAPGSVFTGVGGMDGSLNYEIGGGENIGPAFQTTLTTYAPFFSSRSSLADIIAMGVYTAVRSCGGLPVPVRTGRIDATSAGPVGVPLPQNSLYTFQNQFARFGFNTTEMIAVTACGHTIGGVHAANFPEAVPVGTKPNDYGLFESTTGSFDEKIASEFVSGKTTDPLSVGPSVAKGYNSDARVFVSDSNVTITAMANPTYFQNICKAMLQKLIEVVPQGVTLTDPIVPYDIKPYALQLALLDGGSQLSFTGEIRVRTTTRPASQIASVQLVTKDRTGAAGVTITATSKGSASGFDDSFTFYSFSSKISSTTSISAFNVVVTLTGGGTEQYNNNGNGYLMQDTIMLQSPQSCLSTASGGKNLTVVAAVRTATTGTPSLTVTLKVPQGANTPVPALQASTVALVQGSTIGPYTLYSGSSVIDAGQSTTGKFDLTLGSAGDLFKNVADLSGTCVALGAGSSPTSTSTTAPAPPTSTSTSTKAASTSTTTTAAPPPPSTTSSTAAPPPSTTSTTAAASQPTLAGYTYQGCMTDSVSARVLNGKSTSTNSMSYSACAKFCSAYALFGVEYGSECYCGNSLANPSTAAPASDCSFKCSGDATQVCGAGNRMNLFKSAGSGGVGGTTPPTTGPATNVTVAGWAYRGCYPDSVGARTLTGKSEVSGSLTIEVCAAFCKGFAFFGAEYATECYCGNALAGPGAKVADGDCSQVCAGNGSEVCGAGNRLSLYAAGS